jgi:hypothetical protein
VTVRPVRLNSTIAWLFVVGSACFVLGSVPAYVDAVGATPDAITYVVGAVFFTSASYCQLLQSQTPAATDVDERTQHRPTRLRFWAVLPHDRNWLAAATQFPGTLFFNVSTTAALAHNATAKQQDQHVWRPDIYGSTLFLVASAFAIAALGGRVLSLRPTSLPWLIAWVNMLGSVFFMASALGSFVLPKTGDLINQPLAVAGTLVGALCFLVGAALMLPAWRRGVTAASPSTMASP